MKVKKLFNRRRSDDISKVKVLQVKSASTVVDNNFVITDAWKHPERVDNWLKSFGEGDFSASGFHQSVYPIFIIAQCFGVLPVLNLSAKSPSQLDFSCKSFRFVYAIFTVSGAAFLTFACVAYLIKSTVVFGKIVYLVFYLTSLLSFICFIRLAPLWSKMMIEWNRVEQSLPKFDSIKRRHRNRFKMRAVAAAILTFSLIEHILSVVSLVSVVWDCPKIQNIFQAYTVRSFPMIFFFVPYSLPLSILVKFAHITATFIWSFTDLFIILISMGLSSLFDRINERMIRVKGKLLPSQFWREYREYYRSISDLVSFVDEHIAFITVLSVSNNLFFICVQLLNSMEKMLSWFYGLYFWFSLLYLILRTLAVSLFSAEINDKSKRPVEVLRAIPRESWCLDIKRFTDEVYNDTIALSGKKFFFLTRHLILSVGGTIITYELVLVQFKTNDDIPDYDPCRSNITSFF